MESVDQSDSGERKNTSRVIIQVLFQAWDAGDAKRKRKPIFKRETCSDMLRLRYLRNMVSTQLQPLFAPLTIDNTKFPLVLHTCAGYLHILLPLTLGSFLYFPKLSAAYG
jgi:hypothetical protein